ncbi:MAG: hypothetical protein IJP62_03805, partial [Treponema sp.]|nr:hypothetical protein [Treponema sp.]
GDFLLYDSGEIVFGSLSAQELEKRPLFVRTHLIIIRSVEKDFVRPVVKTRFFVLSADVLEEISRKPFPKHIVKAQEDDIGVFQTG